MLQKYILKRLTVYKEKEYVLIKSMTESTKQRVTGNWFVIWCCFCCTTLFDLCRRRPFESTKPIAFNVHLKRSLSKFAYTLGLGVYVCVATRLKRRGPILIIAQAPHDFLICIFGLTNNCLGYVFRQDFFLAISSFLFFNLNANGSALHKVAVYVCVFVCGRS